MEAGNTVLFVADSDNLVEIDRDTCPAEDFVREMLDTSNYNCMPNSYTWDLLVVAATVLAMPPVKRKVLLSVAAVLQLECCCQLLAMTLPKCLVMDANSQIASWVDLPCSVVVEADFWSRYRYFAGTSQVPRKDLRIRQNFCSQE